jgi:2,5-dihydroxypyridine 5,6-dioxygenase
MIDLVKTMRTPLELNANAGDKVLIVTDTAMEPILWEALATAANTLGIEATVAIMTPRATHALNPTSAICQAAKDPQTDFVIYLTSTALAHSALNAELIELGKRHILMEELTTAMLKPDGPAGADYPAMKVLGQKVEKIFTEGRRVHVSCPNGTDLTASIEGRVGRAIAGTIFQLRDNGAGGCAFPDGETHVCPVEGTGEGRVVFDLTAHSVGALREPIMLTIEKGFVTNIEGGAQADAWKRILEKHGDPASYNAPAEIAIGLNPKVTPTGVMRTDKKMYGTSHIGIGDTVTLGGTCHAKLRLEGVISKPAISVDGQQVTRDGAILVG